MYSKLRLRVFQASLTRSHGNQLLFLVIRGTHQESLTGLAALTGDLSAGLLDLRLGLAPSLQASSAARFHMLVTAAWLERHPSMHHSLQQQLVPKP